MPVIAIDGPSGSGKGTIARRVARASGLAPARQRRPVSPGGARRACARACRPTTSPATPGLATALDVQFRHGRQAARSASSCAGEDVTRELRAEATGEAASRVAAWQEVRSALLGRQRAFARPPGLVADGRDMGSIVFRDAGLKIFLTASAEIGPGGAISS